MGFLKNLITNFIDKVSTITEKFSIPTFSQSKVSRIPISSDFYISDDISVYDDWIDWIKEY